MVQGWGLLSQFSPFRYFPHFPLLSKKALAIEYRVYIWQVSPQLSCGDTCQIWMWFRESNRYFCKIENLLTEKLANGALVTPTPGRTYSGKCWAQMGMGRVYSGLNDAWYCTRIRRQFQISWITLNDNLGSDFILPRLQCVRSKPSQT